MKSERQKIKTKEDSVSSSVLKPQPSTDLWPPCRVACPVHADVQKYVGLIAQGRTKKALEVIRETILFASVCGRICPHPCEDVCRRDDVDEPIAIRALKRFAADVSYSELNLNEASKTIDKKIAVIGAGPAGLTASYDLSGLGYKVTIFEKLSEPGGMLRYGVPRYRLPTDALTQDIKPILKMGVELKTGVEIGKDLDFNGLESQGFDAVLISVGLSLSQGLNIPNSNLEGILLAIPFLRDTNLGKKVEIGKRVIVVGGGDVAMDVARTAIRLGAKEVNIVCLECGDEIPAHSWELEEAKEEGAKLHSAKGPKRFLKKNGRVSGIELMEVKSVFDENGKFCPVFHENKMCVIEGDTVILAIGQAADTSFLEGSSIKLSQEGKLSFDANTFSTSKKGTFACGEVVTGPGAAIEAIASGHNAAKSIDNYLRSGKLQPVRDEVLEEVEELREETVREIEAKKREKISMAPAEERIKTFKEFEQTFKDAQGVREAQRCLSCTVGAEVIKEKCTTCLACLRVCPFDVPYIENGEFVGIDVGQCQSCGLCPSECPAKAINLKFDPEDEVVKQAERVLNEALKNKNSSPILTIICQYGYYLLGETEELVNFKDEVSQVRVLCTARLGADSFLKFFEMGAAAVVIATCAEGDCRYNKGSSRTVERVDYVRDLLKQAGLSGDKLQICSITSEGVKQANQSFKEAINKIKKALKAS